MKPEIIESGRRAELNPDRIRKETLLFRHIVDRAKDGLDSMRFHDIAE